MKTTAALLFAVYVFTGGLCRAQDTASTSERAAQKPEVKFFRLDFVLKDVDEGRVINTRNYSTILATGAPELGRPSVRTGSKIPISTGSGGQYTMMDVGVSFDCKSIALVGNNLVFDLVAEVTSYVPQTRDAETTHEPPVIRQNRWDAPVIIGLRKPVAVFSSDDVSSKRKLQVELTATPIAP